MIDSTNEIQKPLQGMRVLDLSIALAGPYCTLLLGGLGAEVIKVEQQQDGDRVRYNSPYLGSNGIDFSEMTGDNMSLSHLNRNRNKKGITLNLKTTEGKDILYKLAEHADIIVENFSPGTVDRLGISYKDIEKINPGIIYASISGFGQEGPRKHMRAYDTVIQALSGIMDATGFPDGPPTRLGVPMADMLSPLYTTIGILSALSYREKTGLGQYVDVAMLDSLVTFVAGEHYDIFDQYNINYRTGNYHHRLPLFGVFPAKDGYITISALTEGEARKLFKAMNQENVLLDDRFRNTGQRVVNAVALVEIVEKWTKSKTVYELIEELPRQGVICSPVTIAKDVMKDPELIDRKAIVPLFHPLMEKQGEVMGTGLPIKFSKTPVEFDSPAPFLGQHNEEVYCGLLGYSREDMDRLKEQGVI
ncbi:CaiB/BaiF CoA transferase family protein [Peribacillus aracenensis]|uniref:CaiB/BaiF CoA transferase family protein n=1 Tax=Peribacillus aracenensis TaxID=2976708 RepID=UPI0021A8E9F7|nr:CoA transferase [Peribacillus sp. BBB004]